MEEEYIREYLKNNIKPNADVYSRVSYRTSAYLNDGAYLPCVIFRKSADIVDLAIRRFDEERGKLLKKTISHRKIVEHFVTKQNCINSYDIGRIEKSPFALDTKFYEKIWSASETRMSWISFTATMDDDKEFWFGTPYNIEFFEMPEGYGADRVIEIHPHNALSTGTYLRYKPYFDCYLSFL